MNMSRACAVVLVALMFGSNAFALTQREQNEQAQRAYEESARSYEEAAQGWQDAQEAAETVRDAAREILDILL